MVPRFRSSALDRSDLSLSLLAVLPLGEGSQCRLKGERVCLKADLDSGEHKCYFPFPEIESVFLHRTSHDLVTVPIELF